MPEITDEEAREFYKELRCFAGNHVWQAEPAKWYPSRVKKTHGAWLFHVDSFELRTEHRCRHCRELLATDCRTKMPRMIPGLKTSYERIWSRW